MEGRKQVLGVESSEDRSRFFREVLIPPKLAGESLKEPLLEVEVDRSVLTELQQSYVGSLALEIDIEKIKTMLFMEGRQHITVTPMGGKLILLYSPRKGELSTMVRAKEDWLTYYFKEVKPWDTNMFNDKREVWVKVLGVPLHVWGENFFKLVGARFGEFVDFDAATASRSRLDVARIKLSTPCRSLIDTAIQVRAMGCNYQVWVVEEKRPELQWLKEGREEGDEYSYVDSAAVPKMALMKKAGSECSSGEDVGEDEVIGECSNGQTPSDDVMGNKSIPVLHMIGEKRQEGDIQTDLLCTTFKETSTNREVVGVQEEDVMKVTNEARVEENLIALNVMPDGEAEERTDGVLGDGVESDGRGLDQTFWDPLGEEMERVVGDGVDRAPDPFSPDPEFIGPGLEVSVGGPGGVFVENDPNDFCHQKTCVIVSSLSEGQSISLEGKQSSPFPYIQKTNGKVKHRQPQRTNPKCIQFVEAVQNGRKGDRKKKGRKGSSHHQRSHSTQSHDGGSGFDSVQNEEGEVSSTEGREVEKVKETVEFQASGAALLVGDDNSQGSNSEGETVNGDMALQREAKKLLVIQKTVGFSFEVEDRVVCNKMMEDEIRDRAQKLERETVNVDH
ncbi:hypothetical protein QL285_076019 [Trifolium repens]|nr:hypothetical protein QL285_076019 [Trifolium repens]